MEMNTGNEAEERIAILERKIRDMEALVRGLASELLDLRAAAMSMSRENRERNNGEVTVRATASPEPAAPVGSPDATPSGEKIVIRPRSAGRQDEPAAPPEPAMVPIMQPDGTFKLEPRRGNRKMI